MNRIHAALIALGLVPLLVVACTSDGAAPPESEPTAAAFAATTVVPPITSAGAHRTTVVSDHTRPLADLIVRPVVEEGPDAILGMMATVLAPCSFHGTLFDVCAEQGKDVHDQFEAVVVSDMLHCEGCAVDREHLLRALSELYSQGGIPTEGFWGDWGPMPRNLGVGGVDLIGVWVLPESVTRRVEEQWPGLSARLAFGFRSATALEGDLVTGFLLYVDPDGEFPISVISPTSETWTAFDSARELGGWELLYPLP